MSSTQSMLGVPCEWIPEKDYGETKKEEDHSRGRPLRRLLCFVRYYFHAFGGQQIPSNHPSANAVRTFRYSHSLIIQRRIQVNILWLASFLGFQRPDRVAICSPTGHLLIRPFQHPRRVEYYFIANGYSATANHVLNH